MYTYICIYITVGMLEKKLETLLDKINNGNENEKNENEKIEGKLIELEMINVQLKEVCIYIYTYIYLFILIGTIGC
jgi:hypothetical protein